tara:strand:- start:171 stop:650 length:480 start_codon:yes stop_codon:yes gene_type:complete
MASKDKLEEALRIFGEEYITEMGKILIKADKIATRNLIKSLDTRVLKTGFGTSYTLKILAEEYLKYVESGRKAGSKAPPVEPIKEWARAKGIPEGLAFPIAKSIGEKGIKPLDVTNKAFDTVSKNISFRKLEQGASDWVDDIISDRLIGLSKNKNITFK